MTQTAAPERRPSSEVRAEYAYTLRQASENGWHPKCYDRPDLFTDFEYSRTQEEAKELCAGCPMLALCKEYALIVKPDWGVLGGISWIRSRQAMHSSRPVASQAPSI